MTRRPHVLQVVLSLDPGGTERLVIDLSRRLQPRLSMSICCLDAPGAWAEEARAHGVKVRALGRQPGFHPSLGARLARLAREEGASVLHCHQYSPFVYGSIAGLLRPSLRIVYTEHGRLAGATRSAKRVWVNRLLGRRPDCVTAVSDELKGHMVAEGFAEQRVRVIRNGIDPGGEPHPGDSVRARESLGLPPGAFVAGTVARFDPVKRLDVLVEAFAGVARAVPDARLVLVGDGPAGAQLSRLVADRGLAAQVVRPGMRPDARALMPAFDVYVNTSSSEGISLTLLEAMAAARPVVATRAGGNPEVVADGETGTLVPSGDADAVARAILALRNDPRRRTAMGLAARARLVEHFSSDRMLRDYVAAYGGTAAAQPG